MGVPFWILLVPLVVVIAIVAGIFATLMAFFRSQGAARLTESATSEIQTPHQHKSGSGFRFSLRGLLGSVWVIAAIAAQRDLVAVMFVGIPLAVLGFLFVASNASVRCRYSFQLAFLGSVGICCLFSFYLWPRITCPIELPATANRVYVSREWLVTDNPYTYIRFQASVEDCIATAEWLRQSGNAQLNAPAQDINRLNGILPRYARHGQKKWWFHPESIDKGLYYDGMYYHGMHHALVWVDTERGMFYFYDSGF